LYFIERIPKCVDTIVSQPIFIATYKLVYILSV